MPPDLVLRHGRRDGKSQAERNAELADLIARSNGVEASNYREGRLALEHRLVENGMTQADATVKAAEVARKYLRKYDR
jgi:hypothetical protein